MIRVSLTTLIFIYLAVFLSVIFFVWISRNWRRLRQEKEALRHRLRCTLCAFEFEDDTSTLLPRCPRCGSLNERFQFSSL
jgi:hypothetical protein